MRRQIFQSENRLQLASENMEWSATCKSRIKDEIPDLQITPSFDET